MIVLSFRIIWQLCGGRIDNENEGGEESVETRS